MRVRDLGARWFVYRARFIVLTLLTVGSAAFGKLRQCGWVLPMFKGILQGAFKDAVPKFL